MDVFRSCVRYAAKNEMATSLDDVIFRRTDLGPRGLITSELLQAATDEMTDQIGWSADVAQKQFSKVESQLRYAIN
jgi:glycerol-3-phosphate dehydrogenase